MSNWKYNEIVDEHLLMLKRSDLNEIAIEGMDGVGPSDFFDLFSGGGRRNVKKITKSAPQDICSTR